jgi:hypothetical protein
LSIPSYFILKERVQSKPIKERFGGPQSQKGYFGEEKKIEPWFFGCPSP